MARSILLKIGGESVSVLEEAIVDAPSDYDKKLKLAKILGEIGDQRGVAPLFQVLKEGFDQEEGPTSHLTDSLMVSAVEALEKISGKDLLFPDENSRIAFSVGHFNRVCRQGGDRREALDSLLQYIDNDRIARLLLNFVAKASSLEEGYYIGSKFVERGDHRVVESLLARLAKLMAKDNIIKSDFLEASEREARKIAAKLLGNLGGKEAERILIDAILDDSKEVRQSARDALIKIGNPRIIEPLTKGIEMKKKNGYELYKDIMNRRAYEQRVADEFDEAYEVLRTIDKRPKTLLGNLLGRRKY